MRGWLVVMMALWAGMAGIGRAQEPEIPPPMPLVDTGGQHIVNVLLIGLATHGSRDNGLTDSLQLISYNRDAGHASILSLPRDLYVYLPYSATMAKLNQAFLYGNRVADDGFSGLDELKATIRYNLGVEVHYTARLNFGGFVRLIDSLGGIEISVDCAIQDWRLISPDADRTLAENYFRFTLEQGVHRMDGDTALWYVRTRRTSTDLDRGRRQQDVLRAVWRRIQARGMLQSLPDLWQSWGEIVTTDMPLEVALSYVPDLLELTTSDISYFNFRINRDIRNDFTPDDQRRFIFRMDRDAVQRLMQQMMQASSTHRVAIAQPTVKLINGTGDRSYNFIARIAADRLELEGFRTIIAEQQTRPRNFNHIIDHVGDERGGALDTLMRVLSTTAAGVQVAPDPHRSVDYTVYLGYNYLGYACTRPVQPPEPDPPPAANG